jgi:hypothetical protein
MKDEKKEEKNNWERRKRRKPCTGATSSTTNRTPGTEPRHPTSARLRSVLGRFSQELQFKLAGVPVTLWTWVRELL